MTSSKFQIPRCATLLREVDLSTLDLRPEGELFSALRTHIPVTTEKNVWAFWDKGVEAMPPSYRHTVLNWMRKLGPTWTVRIVDLISSSPNNIYGYVDQAWFPECFVKRTMDGPHAPQHSADLARLPLLYEHGGVWMDVGNMLHTHLDSLFWDALSDLHTPYEMGVWIISGQIRKQWGSFGNYMLAARKGCQFIKTWHEGYAGLWRERTNCSGLCDEGVIKEIGLAEGMAAWGFVDKVRQMSDYVAQMLVGDRTRNLLDVRTGWNGREFWEEKVFMVEGINNGVLGAIRTDFDGERQVHLFTTRLDEKDEAKRRAAEDFVVEMLVYSHMYKVYHNSVGGLPALGDLIKKEGYRDADHRPGTFGELYRYGTVFWESTRGVERLEPQPSEESLIIATPTEPTNEGYAGELKGGKVSVK